MIEDPLAPWQKPGKWAQCGITGLGFPREPLAIKFRSQTLYLLPGKSQEDGDTFGDSYPVVAFEHSGMSFEDAQKLISSFINGVAWVRRTPIDTAQFGGGSRVHRLGGQNARALVDDHFELNYLPEPTEEKARLALAFYREGLTLNSAAYQCLSYFKVLNTLLDKGPSLKDWINQNIHEARAQAPLTTQNWEKVSGNDLTNTSPGEYLYHSNRCAIAHAFAEPLIDPDNPYDRRRLANDLPILKALAEHFIEKEHGIKSAHTVWKEHLYELEGFKLLLGQNIVERIINGEQISADEFSALPCMSIRLANAEQFLTFENMRPELIECYNSTLNIMLTSQFDNGSALLSLNFSSERLDFELFEHLAVSDDGSVQGAQAQLDYLRFAQRYIGNGKLEIWIDKRRISRRDAYIPHNIDLGRSLKNYEIMISDAEKTLANRLANKITL